MRRVQRDVRRASFLHREADFAMVVLARRRAQRAGRLMRDGGLGRLRRLALLDDRLQAARRAASADELAMAGLAGLT